MLDPTPEQAELAEKRLEACYGCPFRDVITQICGECYCFIPAKVYTIQEELKCPINRWPDQKKEEDDADLRTV